MFQLPKKSFSKFEFETVLPSPKDNHLRGLILENIEFAKFLSLNFSYYQSEKRRRYDYQDTVRT